MGKKFKVKVIAISLKGNKIAEAGEIVDEVQLAGDSKVLVKGGYILPVEEKTIDKMTVDELKTYITENKLEVDLKLNKGDLLEAIKKEESKGEE